MAEFQVEDVLLDAGQREQEDRFSSRAGHQLLGEDGFECLELLPELIRISARHMIRTLDDTISALEAAGVEFTNGEQPGVRLRSPSSRGQSGKEIS